MTAPDREEMLAAVEACAETCGDSWPDWRDALRALITACREDAATIERLVKDKEIERELRIGAAETIKVQLDQIERLTARVAELEFSRAEDARQIESLEADLVRWQAR